MSKIIIRILTISLLAFSLSNLSAQETTVVTSDFESWSSIGLKAKLTKQFEINLEQGMRFNKNSTELDQALTELGINYKLPYNFQVGVGFRYIYDRDKNDTYDNDFRYNLDASYSNKLERLKYKFRFRYQNKNEIAYSLSDGDEYKPYGRAKLGLEYNIKNWKLDPQISGEVFRDLSAPGEYDKLRMVLGTSYDIKKYGDIKIFYGIERELNATLPKTTYITGLKYNYTFKTY